jgi:hypothetical protein
MEHPLPIHPRTGLPALGWRKARTGEDGPQPIWPILGGSGEGEEGAGETGETAEGEAAEGGEAGAEGEGELGDAGRRALDRLRADLKAEKERRKAAESNLAAATAASQGKQGSEETPSVEQLREQALAQARAETLNERALDRLEARAAKKFHDPADARAFLATRVGEFVDGAQIDNGAIDDALAELLTARPYLGAQPATGRPRFEGTGDGGARKGSEGPKQLGKADIARMSAEQIVAAQKAGQLDDYLATET